MKQTQNSENILGYQVSTEAISQSVSRVVQWLDNGINKKIFVCANPHSLVQAADDPEFQQAIHNADLVTPDGSGILEQ